MQKVLRKNLQQTFCVLSNSDTKKSLLRLSKGKQEKLYMRYNVVNDHIIFYLYGSVGRLLSESVGKIYVKCNKHYETIAYSLV